MPAAKPQRFSPARLRAIRIVRWLSLPLAAFILVVPTREVYKEWALRKGSARFPATIIEVTSNNSSHTRLPVYQYDLWVSYLPDERANVRVISHRQLHPKDSIRLLRNPGSGRLEVDPFPESWWIVGGVVAVGALFVISIFFLAGAVLRDQNSGRVPV